MLGNQDLQDQRTLCKVESWEFQGVANVMVSVVSVGDLADHEPQASTFPWHGG